MTNDEATLAVLRAIDAGRHTFRDIIAYTEPNPKKRDGIMRRLDAAVQRLRRTGVIRQASRGVWVRS